jgi:N-acetylglucosaminyl-diphospho-decaprenol L-rhamnosyltransferase
LDQDHMTVDAIVVSFNTKALLRRCLKSAFSSQHRLRRVYVVDNASVDGSADLVDHEFPDVVLLRMTRNVGFARANNIAYGQSDADAILLLNSDAELSRGAVGVLVSQLATDDHIGIAGPMLVTPEGGVQYEGARRDPSIVGEFGNISHLNVRLPRSALGRYLMNDWDHYSTRDVEVLSGACMLVRTSSLEGRLFSEDFFMYGEDVELCQRLRARGWRMRYAAESRVLHHGAGSSRHAKTRTRIAGLISMAQLMSRNRGVCYAIAYLAIVPVAWPLGSIVRRVWIV